MKFCIIMSSPRESGNTAELCKPFTNGLRANGADVSYIALADKSCPTLVATPAKMCKESTAASKETMFQPF